MNNRVIVIGAGVAGMTAAAALAEHGTEVLLLEKEKSPGGHIRGWERLFPSRRPALEVMDFITRGIADGVTLYCGAEIVDIAKEDGNFVVKLADGEPLAANSIVIATGYDLFSAERKEEYGYGIYDNVITSAELEGIFKEGRPLVTASGQPPKRVGIIHCVGSRDEKAGNLYCSKVCCVTGIKQAIEIRGMLPDCEVFSFYMDLRMYDRHFEELYMEAQQKWGVNFIRGRLSECAENRDHTIVLKTEDTLTGRPLKMQVDLAVLLVGFTPRPETKRIAAMLGLTVGADGFLDPADEHILNNSTSVPGVFLAGAVKGPACIANTIADARAAAGQVRTYLNSEIAK